MDLSKMKNNRKLYLCRWYYLGEKLFKKLHPEDVNTKDCTSAALHYFLYAIFSGFAFLPFLWCVNAVWFFKDAFIKPPYEEQKSIKKYVILSAIGALIWVAGLTTWIVTFQTQRAQWGETADYMSFIIPTGIA